MGVPSYGTAPLAKTFLIIRALQLICFTSIIGITANFISEIIATNHVAPQEIVGTITVTSIAALYSLITIPFFWAPANIGLLVMCALDFLLTIAFVVIAVVLGKPLATLNCFIVNDASKAGNAAGAYDFTQSISANINKYGNYVAWSGATKTNCFASKAAWGLSIALCILFTCSSLVLPALFAKQKRAARTAQKLGA